MFKKLKLLLQGKLPDYNEYLSVTLELSEAQKTVDRLQKQIEENIRLQSRMVPLAGFDDLSHEPTDTKARMQYAATVGEFYDSILKVKIRTSVAEVRELLSNVGFTEGIPVANMSRDQYDFFLRGMEAGLWKIHEWATLIQAELKQDN